MGDKISKLLIGVFLVKIEVLFSITEATLDKHNKGEKYYIVFIK